jgi:hypothetical protein
MGENLGSTVNTIHIHYVTTILQEFIALNTTLHEQRMK